MRRRIYREIVAPVLAGSFAIGIWAAPLPKEVPGLHYPRVAQLARLEGTVVLEVSVGLDGKATGIKVLSGHPILAAAAKANAGLWTFERRARNQGDGNIRLTFVFRLAGECKTQCCEDRFVFRYPDYVTITASLPQVQGAAQGSAP